MLTRLYRQRRRLLWVGLCVGAAGLARGGSPAFGALAGMAAAALLLWLAPRQRSLLDGGGLALAGLAALPVPTAALPLLWPLGAALAQGLLYGRWWDRTGLSLSLRSRARITLNAAPDRIWQALVPGEGHPDDHLSGTLVDFDTDPQDDLTLYLRHVLPDGSVEETTATFLDRQPPRRCTYLLDRQDGPLPHEVEVRLRLVPLGQGRTALRYQTRAARLPLRLVLAGWFDDPAGDTLDSLRAHLSGAADWSISRPPGAGNVPPATINWPDAWPNPPQVQRPMA